MRLPRLFAAIFAFSLLRELTFRAQFVFQVLMTATGIAAGLAALGLVYTRTATLGGWSEGEAIVLLGTYSMVSGVLATFIEPNLAWFAEGVRSGKLDDILLKPVPSMFLASLGTAAPLGLAQVVLGIGLVGGGLRQSDVRLTLGGVLGWLLLLAAGTAITWASRVALASLAFWAPAVTPDVLYGAFWQLGRYPVSIYHPALRALLTYVIPVAFVSTFPARALTRGADPALLTQGIAAALAAVWAVRVAWRAGLRRYTSATS